MNRSLGFWETVKVLTHDLFAGSDIVVLDLQLNGSLNLDLLKQALQISFHRHPLLRATIHQKQGFYFFDIGHEFNKIPFCVFEQANNKCREFIENEMNKLFRKEEYLWRMNVINATDSKETHLIFSFHHAMCDGTSLFYFLDELLNHYAQLELGLIPKINPLSVNDPQEKYLPQKIDWKTYLKKATRYQHIDDGWKFKKNIDFEKRKTRLLVKQLPLALIDRLIKLCERNKVSLNAFFNALSLITKYQLDNAAYDGVLWSWVNTRNICSPKISNEYFGYFVNAIATQHQNINAQTNIWKLAREYYSQLKKGLADLVYFPDNFNQQHAMAYYNMKQIPKLNHFLYDFTLSYLDQIPLKKKYGSLVVADVLLGVNINSGIAGMVLEIFQFAEHISFACCFVEPLLNEQWVIKYMDKFQENITNLLA